MAGLDSIWQWAAQHWSMPPLHLVMMLSLRVAGVFFLTPIFYAMPMPSTVRALLVLSLSFLIAVGIAPPIPDGWSVEGNLFSRAMVELALGATLGLGVLVAFAAFDIAGRLLDIQIGFGIAQVFDPVSQRQVPILSSAFNTTAVLLFFVLDGHHALLRGIAFSVSRFPVGEAWDLSSAVGPVMRHVGGLFALGLSVAAPIVFCIFMLEIALGVVARNLPQMNMFAIGIPMKIVVGLVAISLWFTGIGGLMSKVYQTIFSTWDTSLSSSDFIPRGLGEAEHTSG